MCEPKHSQKVQEDQRSLSLHAAQANQQYHGSQPNPGDPRALQYPKSQDRDDWVMKYSQYLANIAGDLDWMLASVSGTYSFLWSAKINSQASLPLQALLSLPVGLVVREAQHLQVFLKGRHHHEHPLVHLYQRGQEDQQGQGYPLMKRQNFTE